MLQKNYVCDYEKCNFLNEPVSYNQQMRTSKRIHTLTDIKAPLESNVPILSTSSVFVVLHSGRQSGDKCTVVSTSSSHKVTSKLKPCPRPGNTTFYILDLGFVQDQISTSRSPGAALTQISNFSYYKCSTF